MKSSLLLLTLFLGPTLARAEELVRWHDEPAGARFAILHDEGGAWFVDEFFRPRGAFPRREASAKFATDAAARRAFADRTAGFATEEPAWLRARDAAPRGTSVVWETKNEWNADWESRYHDWTQSTATADYLKDHGVATDCADVAYAFRWIFARLHGLPAANRLGGTGELLSNEAGLAEWATLPTDAEWSRDQRFLAALNYVLDHTFTHTLMRDSYPIAIREDSLSSGAYFLNLYSDETGHTEFVQDFIKDDEHPEPLRMLASDVPRSLRTLNAYGFRAPPATLRDGGAAFLRMLWPVRVDGALQLAEPAAMPFYSREQFDPNFSRGSADFGEAAVRHLLPNWHPDAAASAKGILAQLGDRWRARVAIVNDGFAFCQTHDCAPGTPGYENWSTPSRDRATATLVGLFDGIYNGPACGLFCRWGLRSALKAPAVDTGAGTLSVEQALAVWREQRYSSEPADSIAKRWGF